MSGTKRIGGRRGFPGYLEEDRKEESASGKDTGEKKNPNLLGRKPAVDKFPTETESFLERVAEVRKGEIAKAETLMDYEEEMKRLCALPTNIRMFAGQISDIVGLKVTVNQVERVIRKMYGNVAITRIGHGQRVKIMEFFVLRIKLGYDMSVDVVKNLEKVRESGGMMIELMKEALMCVAMSDNPKEILKYVPQQVWQDYFFAGLSGERSGINEGVDSLVKQLPVIANAEVRGEKKEEVAEEVKPVGEANFIDTILDDYDGGLE